MAQLNPRYTEYADALIERFEECGVCITDHSRRLVRVTVVGWLEELLARKRASRLPTPAPVPDLVAETPGNVSKSRRQSFSRWIVHWIFSIGFTLLGLFVLWTFPLHFDEEPTQGVKK
jgi:hypothetical protein